MPTETLDPRELELWRPLAGTKFRMGGVPYTVVGRMVIMGTTLVRKDGSNDCRWIGVRAVARLVRDQGGAT